MKANNNFEESLKAYLPNIFQKYTSKQNELSKEILELRVLNHLSIEQVSKLLNISVGEYINYEYGELNKTIEDYYLIINQIKEIIELRDKNVNG